MEDSIARALVAVAGATEVDFVGVAGARADALRVEVVGVVVVRVVQPLVVVQVEDVLFLANVRIAELDEVADVTVVHVGRVFGADDVVGLRALRARRRRLAGQQRFEAQVGRHVHRQGRVTDRERSQEELFVGAAEAVVHRADTEPVGDDLGADAARAVIDHEAVFDAGQHIAEHRVGLEETGERLRRARLVMEQGREIAEGLQAVRHRRVALALAFQRVGRSREGPVRVRAGHHGVDLGVHDGACLGRRAVHHVQDRQPGLAFGRPGGGRRVGRFIATGLRTVDAAAPVGELGLAVAREFGRVEHAVAVDVGGQAQFFFLHLAAVDPGAGGLDDDLAEQAVGRVALVGVGAEAAAAGDVEHAFLFSVEPVDLGASAGAGETVGGVGADPAAVAVDAVQELHAASLEGDSAVLDLLVDLDVEDLARRRDVVGWNVTRIGRRSKQVGQVDGQAVTLAHAQHERAVPLVGAQVDIAWRGRTPCGEWQFARLIDNVALERIHHAVDVASAEAVVHQRLVERDHVGRDLALANNGRLCLAAREQRQADGQQRGQGCTLANAIHCRHVPCPRLIEILAHAILPPS